MLTKICRTNLNKKYLNIKYYVPIFAEDESNCALNNHFLRQIICNILRMSYINVNQNQRIIQFHKCKIC